jgi:hypothetical protein
MDAHTPMADGTKARKPQPRDLGICAECGISLVFGDDMRLHKATEEDLAEVPPDILEKMFLARLMRMANPRKPKEQTRQ